MIEKVNPSHPDKIADRIAGAIVDLAYTKEENPKIAVEVLIGHGECNVIIESCCEFTNEEVFEIVKRITGRGDILTRVNCVKQDEHLSKNQAKKIRCGDNGIFKGVPLTNNEKEISEMARYIYSKYPYDGKYILTDDKVIICQSNAKSDYLKRDLSMRIFGKDIIFNPLGNWTGGTDVDAGATNRKLGSDMAQSVTGGGLHGKDLSKADVSINIYVFQLAQKKQKPVSAMCAIGDNFIDVYVDGEDTIARVPYSEIVEIARDYINKLGGFEKFAEWGLF